MVKFLYHQLVVPAKRDCAGMELDRRLIRIDFALTNKPHNPTTGLYLGRRGDGGDGHGHGGRGCHNGRNSGVSGVMVAVVEII